MTYFRLIKRLIKNAWPVKSLPGSVKSAYPTIVPAGIGCTRSGTVWIIEVVKRMAV
jgi:hypothetical protein